jgi:hypothetical protein
MVQATISASIDRSLRSQGHDMWGILFSTMAFFVASYYLKRYVEEMGLPKGMTRNILVFSLALAIAYIVASAVSYFLP